MICVVEVNAQTPNGGIYNSGANIVISSGTYLYIDGDDNGDYYNKDAGATDGLIDIQAGGRLILEGDFITDANTDPITSAASTKGYVEFKGSDATSQIGGGSTSIGFSNITFNKTSGGYTLLNNVSSKGVINFAAAGVVTTGSNILTMESTTASNLQGTFSGSDRFVYGSLRRYIANGTTDATEYFMPVGSSTASTNYHPAGFFGSATGTTGVTYLTASVAHPAKSGNNQDNVFTQKWGSTDPITGTAESAGSAGNMLEWTISADANPSGGTTYGVRLYTKNVSGLTDNKFTIMKRPEASTTVADFIFPTSIPSADASGRIDNGGNGYGEGTGFTSFSKFIIAKSSNVLPVELLLFKGRCEDGDIRLQWTTATETNNNYFTVQKSKNGESFYDIGVVETKALFGNSNQVLDYDYMNMSESSSAYYRIEQTDRDGKSSLSPAIYVKSCDSEQDIVVVNAYALGNKDIVVQIETPENKNFNVALLDLSGRNVLQPIQVNAFKGNTVKELKTNNIATGFYLLHVYNENETYSQKLFLR